MIIHGSGLVERGSWPVGLSPRGPRGKTADEVILADNPANRRRQLQADKRLLKLRREEAKTYHLGVPEKLKEEEERGYR